MNLTFQPVGVLLFFFFYCFRRFSIVGDFLTKGAGFSDENPQVSSLPGRPLLADVMCLLQDFWLVKESV